MSRNYCDRVICDAIALGILKVEEDDLRDDEQQDGEEHVLVPREYNTEESMLVSAYAEELSKNENAAELLRMKNAAVQKLRRTAYERYKLAWMWSGGHTISDIFSEIADFAEDSDDEDRICDKHALSDLFDSWEQSGGFGGQIWACFDEFLGAEYRNLDYMVWEIFRDPALLDEYLEDYCRLTGKQLGTLVVRQKNGHLSSTRCVFDPDDGSFEIACKRLAGDLVQTATWEAAHINIGTPGSTYILQKVRPDTWAVSTALNITVKESTK